MTQKRKICLLIIVFAALICIYMWVRAWNQSEQAQANTMIRITDTEGDKIKKITLNIENGELNFEKENGVWYDPSLPLVHRKSELIRLRFSSLYAVFPVFMRDFRF